MRIRYLFFMIFKIERLIYRSKPFWTYNRRALTPAGDFFIEIAAIGIEDLYTPFANEVKKIMKTYRRPISHVIPTGNPYRIDLVRTKHGLPIFALSRLPEYADSYKHMKQMPNVWLHIDKKWNDLPIELLLPGSEEEDLKWFALGNALNYSKTGKPFIYRRAEWYYCSIFQEEVADCNKKDKKLGHGRCEAFEAFSRSDDLKNEVKEFAESKVNKEDHSLIEQELKQYIDNAAGNLHIQDDDLGNLIRKELNSIKDFCDHLKNDK